MDSPKSDSSTEELFEGPAADECIEEKKRRLNDYYKCLCKYISLYFNTFIFYVLVIKSCLYLILPI